MNRSNVTHTPLTNREAAERRLCLICGRENGRFYSLVDTRLWCICPTCEHEEYAKCEHDAYASNQLAGAELLEPLLTPRLGEPALCEGDCGRIVDTQIPSKNADRPSCLWCALDRARLIAIILAPVRLAELAEPERSKAAERLRERAKRNAVWIAQISNCDKNT
jgi:hypothetical protein